MLRSSKAELIGAATVFCLSLLLYSFTLAPTVTLVDSGELILAAHSLGVAHPPGFPLYLMLAHLFAIVPVGSVAVRVNFASAFFAALACAMLTLVVSEIIEIINRASHLAESERRLKKAARKGKKVSSYSVPTAAADTSKWLITVLSATGAGSLLAFSRTLWSYATIAEVYSLNTALILTIFFLMLRWRRRVIEDQGSTSGIARRSGTAGIVTSHDSLLYSAAAIFGFALGVHHVTVALILPALAILVYETQGLKFFASKRLLYAALISSAALFAVYSYLPLAAAGNPILNWGDPRSLDKIWAHITGRQYSLFFSFSPSIIGEEFLRFGRFLLREFGVQWFPIALVVAFAGFIAAWKQDRTTFLWLLFVVLFNLAYTLNYEIAEDKDAYHLPVFVAIAIAAGIGFHWLLEVTFAKRSSIGKMAFIPAVALIPVLALASNWPFNNRSHYFIAHDYIDNIQNAIEPNGLLLTSDWQVASPMLYSREIEEQRRDIRAVDVLLLRRSWYFDYLRRVYPDLIARSRDQVDAYLNQLKQWEQDPAAYKRSAALTREISSAFQELTRSLVSKELKVASVYVTADLILLRKALDADFIEWLNQNFQAIPRGLVFQLVRDASFHDVAELRLQTRGLTDGTIRFADDDVVKIKVLPTYKAMLESRGQYLAHFNQKERAGVAFEEARHFNAR